MGEEHMLHGTNLFKNQSWTGYMLNMTSQKWLTDADFAPNSDTKSIWYGTFSITIIYVRYLMVMQHMTGGTFW